MHVVGLNANASVLALLGFQLHAGCGNGINKRNQLVRFVPHNHQHEKALF